MEKVFFIFAFFILFGQAFSHRQTEQDPLCGIQGKCVDVVLYTQIVDTHGGCLELCQSESECQWYSFNTEELVCILLSNCELLDESDLDYRSGEKRCETVLDKEKEELDIWNLESKGRKVFETSPFTIYKKFYLFEVINGDEVSNGSETPILIERGPYTYKEVLRKIEVSNQTLSDCYIRTGQYKEYVFDQEKSCEGCSPDDNITVVNAPYIGLAANFRSKPFNSFTENLFKWMNLASTTGSDSEDGQGFNEDYIDKLFREVNVGEYLFSGWKHGVLKYFLDNHYALLASSLPPQITLEGFAVFNGKNSTANNEYYEFDTGYCNELNESDYSLSDMKNYLQIRQYGQSLDKLSTDLNSTRWWKKNGGYKGSNACNDIQGTDFIHFHPNLNPEEKLTIFQTDFCRTLLLSFKERTEVESIPAFLFSLSPEALQVNRTSNIGFCNQYVKDVDFDACIEETSDPDILDISRCFNGQRPLINQCYDGLLNISSCQKGFSLILSSPYFYQSPDFLRQAVNLPVGDPELHETRVYIEPMLGIPVKLEKRVQINIPLLPDDGFELLKNVKETLMPVLWFQEEGVIEQERVDILKKYLGDP